MIPYDVKPTKYSQWLCHSHNFGFGQHYLVWGWGTTINNERFNNNTIIIIQVYTFAPVGRPSPSAGALFWPFLPRMPSMPFLSES